MAAPWHPRDIEAVTNRRPLRKICRLSSSISTANDTPPYLTFGPCYPARGSWASNAWLFVLENSPDAEEPSDVYLSAIGRIEKKARNTYEDVILRGVTESQFQWMMVKDGFFFLQLALFILGASEQLRYPDHHPIFGAMQNKKVFQWSRESMFCVGNQIPLVVLTELMKQTFFQDVIKRHGKWERPTDLFSKQVLYDLLILPATEYATRKTSSSPLEMLIRRKTYMSEEQPSDLLHGLQNLLLGRRGSKNDYSEEDEEDVAEEEGVLKAGRPLNINESQGDVEAGRPLNINESQGDVEAGRPLNIKESLCVSRFAKKGIYLRESTGVGIRGIKFKNHMFYARLYLPTMLANEETEMLFHHLKRYERTQKQNVVASYLGFMNQLISTYDDVERLAEKGIIQASKPYYKMKSLRILRSYRQETIAPRYRSIMRQVGDYTVWNKFRDIAILAVLSYASQLRRPSPA